MSQNYRTVLLSITHVLLFSTVLMNYSSASFAEEIKQSNPAAPISNNRQVEKKIEWRQQSSEAAQLILSDHYAEANSILIKIIPLAKKENANSLDYGVCLIRYGYGLIGDKQFRQALNILEEAQIVVCKNTRTNAQEKALFQTYKGLAAAYFNLKEYEKAEELARIAIAYRIALPDISSIDSFKNTYDLLQMALEKQNKVQEAKSIYKINDALLAKTTSAKKKSALSNAREEKIDKTATEKSQTDAAKAPSETPSNSKWFIPVENLTD